MSARLLGFLFLSDSTIFYVLLEEKQGEELVLRVFDRKKK